MTVLDLIKLLIDTDTSQEVYIGFDRDGSGHVMDAFTILHVDPDIDGVSIMIEKGNAKEVYKI